jgi:hypothetical protein
MNEAERLEERQHRELQARQQAQVAQQQQQQHQPPPQSMRTNAFATAALTTLKTTFLVQTESRNAKLLCKQVEEVASFDNPHSSIQAYSPLVRPTTQHQDIVTELAVLAASSHASQMLISASRDGVIKLWK